MSRRNIEDSHPVVLKCALLITGLSYDSFHTKDVIFQVDLVKNIFSASNHFADFNLQSLQIIRLFEKYSADGWASIHTGKNAKSFQFHPNGLFEILKSLVVLDYVLPVPEAIFLQWFLDAYRSFIFYKFEGKISDQEWKVLHDITAADYIFMHQIRLIEKGILDLEIRIRDSSRLQAYIQESKKKQLTLDETLDQMPSEFSYRLSHQKRLRDWMKDLPEKVRDFEINGGIAMRQQNLYQRSLDFLVHTKTFYQNNLMAK